jgi:predicted TPR repeat methyltransferase
MSSQDEMSLQGAFDIAMQCEARGEHENALALLKQIHEVVPHEPECLHSMGAILVNMGKFDAAVPYLWEAVRRLCSTKNVHDLLSALLGAHRLEEADSVCRATKAVVDDDAKLLGLWGYALMSLRRFAEAIEILERAKALDPAMAIPSIRHNLSICLVNSDRGEDAVAVYSLIVKPWDGEVSRLDVGRHYGIHASGYDNKPIHRSFSEILLNRSRSAAPGRLNGRILDLGCGTGLLAAQLDEPADWITGIDISPHMLDQARGKGDYDELILGDVTEAMAGLYETYDTIFSSCAFYHIADLRPVVRQVARLLNRGGIFAFSVDPSADGTDIGVTGLGEFCHSRDYIRRLAAEFGLTELAITIGAHRGPPGFWCVFVKLDGGVTFLH